MENFGQLGSPVLFGLIGWLLGVVVNWLSDQLPFVGLKRQLDSDSDEQQAFRSKLGSPRCNHCGRTYGIVEYSGLLAYVTGKRKCNNCKQHRSFRDVIVELFLIAGTIYIMLTIQPIGVAIALSFYLVAFTLICVIDVEHRWVLNFVVFPLVAIVIIESLISGRVTPEQWQSRLAGFAVGQIVVTGIYLFGELYLWNLNRRRKEPVTEVAFGSGDITLATLSGLILGTPNIVYSLILMMALGLVLIPIYLGGQLIKGKGLKSNVPIAYGPAILASCMAMLLWPEQVVTLMYGGR